MAADIELLKSEIDELRDKVKSMMRGNSAKENILERAKSILEQSERGIEKGWDSTVQMTQKTSREVDNFVHDNPWTSVGISVAFGYLMGLLLSGKGKE